MEVKDVPFYLHHFSYKGGRLIQYSRYRKDLRKYSSAEVKQVLTKAGTLQKNLPNSDIFIETANMLFWAYVSGSKEAENLLKNFESKYGPFDGAISEGWGEIYNLYLHWKHLNDK